MRRAHRLIGAVVLSLSLSLGGILSVAPGANAASISQAYYLFYSRIKSIQANCVGSNRYISYHGKIKLRHNRIWRTVLHSQSSGGDLVTETYWRKGFSTAYQEEFCRKGDFVWEFLRRAQGAAGLLAGLARQRRELRVPLLQDLGLAKLQLDLAQAAFLARRPARRPRPGTAAPGGMCHLTALPAGVGCCTRGRT